VTPEATRLVTRRGLDRTATYPELRNLATHVNALQAVLDGEICAHEPSGRPSFELMQQRMNLGSPADIERVRAKIPVVLYAFDLLWVDGEDLTPEPLEARRARLQEICTEGGPLRLTIYRDGDGKALYGVAAQMGLEGVVAKRLGSRYVPGLRTKDWRKIKARHTIDCVVLGWTRGSGSRAGTLGALLLGAYEEGELQWIGQVGTGFSHAFLQTLLPMLEDLETPEPPVADTELAAMTDARWMRPELVCEVEYLEFTSARKLRAPVFKRLRPDKDPADCSLDGSAG
jgi:bifunctional non-homologous end joining protein LigD